MNRTADQRLPNDDLLRLLGVVEGMGGGTHLDSVLPIESC